MYAWTSLEGYTETGKSGWWGRGAQWDQEAAGEAWEGNLLIYTVLLLYTFVSVEFHIM